MRAKNLQAQMQQPSTTKTKPTPTASPQRHLQPTKSSAKKTTAKHLPGPAVATTGTAKVVLLQVEFLMQMLKNWNYSIIIYNWCNSLKGNVRTNMVFAVNFDLWLGGTAGWP